MGDSAYFQKGSGQPSSPGRIVAVNTDLPEIVLGPGLRSRPLIGTNLLGNFVTYEQNAIAPVHAHEEEQFFVVLEGVLELTVGADVKRVQKGDAALIPAWVPHSARSVGELAYQLDVFSPPRKALLALVDALNESDQLMRALVADGRGSAVISEVPEPVRHVDGAVVEVHSTSLNRGDMTRLKSAAQGWRPGFDFAGIVLEAGANAVCWDKGGRYRGWRGME